MTNETICEFCGAIIEDEGYDVEGRVYCDSDCAERDGWRTCERCGSFVHEDDAIAIEGNFYCDTVCAERDGWVQCASCGDWVSDSYAIYVDAAYEWYCDEGCAENDGWVQCSRCGEWVHDDDTYYVLAPYGETWCRDCTESHAEYCDECDEYYDSDEDYCPRCGSCGGLHEYGYTPRISFFGERGDTPFLGIELETDASCYASRADYVRELSELDDFEELFWMTRDGSLNNGVELTSMPMTLDFLVRKHELFEEIARVAREHEFTSHDAGTCGLHIHISRDFFGKTTKAQNCGGYKMMRLLQRFERPFTVLSRREETGWCRFETRYDYTPKTVVPKIRSEYEYPDNGDNIFQKAANMVRREDDHNQVLNFQHYATFELRMFRGTLNLRSLFASFALANGLAHVAKSHGEVWCENVDWYTLIGEIVNNVDNEFAKDELHAYVTDKGMC